MPIPASIRIVGLGNVLMGDDAFGPAVVSAIADRYEFDEEVEVLDLGTPGGDLVPHLAGASLLVVVDTVKSGAAPGTVQVFTRDALLAQPLEPRVSPHDPGLKNALLMLEFAGIGPAEMFLVGAVPEKVASWPGRTPPVTAAIEPAIAAVLTLLAARGIQPRRRPAPSHAAPWWNAPVEGFTTFAL